MNAQFEIPPQVLSEAMAESLFKGDLGDKVAAQLADRYAEVTTYNRTDAAKLLNIGRNTLYDYENKGALRFRSDGRISLAALLDFSRNFGAGSEDEAAGVNRKTRKEKKRKF